MPPRPFPPNPPREIPYSIESIEIDASISGTVARVDVAQTFKNEGSATLETSFVFPLPYDGAVDSMTLLVDGKETPAQLVEASDARKQYEEIVRKARDPALLEWIGVGLFKTSVFPIPAGETRTVTMRYSQLLRSDSGLVEFLFPLGAAKYSSKPAKKIAFDVTVVADAEIKNVYSPTYDINATRPAKNRANIQCMLQNATPTRDFRLFYDQDPGELSTKLVSYRPDDKEDGYFLLLAHPEIAENDAKPIPQTVVFCLDASGSMSGEKIAQAREAIKFVLSRLRDDDLFNVVVFANDAESFKEEMQRCDAQTRGQALDYVEGIRARGGTNISQALSRSLSLLNSDSSTNPKRLVFVSDGEPTVGETNEMKLAQFGRENNKKDARVFTFGLGYDVNARLLDRFVRDGRGRGEYVKPEENVEERVAAFYSHIEAPVFSEMEFSFELPEKPEKHHFVNQVYPSGATDIFAGEQLVATGRYSESGAVKIIAKGKAGDKDEEKVFDGVLVAKSNDATNAFVERLWAVRRIGEIIDELDLNGANQELVDELVELSKKHGVMTPYTSFLAREDVKLNETSANAATAADSFAAISSNVVGVAGVMQRSAKQLFRNSNNLAEAQNGSDVASSDAFVVPESDEALVMADSEFPQSANSRSFSSGMGGASVRPRLSAPRARAAVMGSASASSNPKTAAQVSDVIRTLDDKTFFRRGDRWVDSSITEDQEKNAKPVVMRQFDDDYFKLIERFGGKLSRYLVFDEPVDLNFNGTLYRIERPEE